MSANVKSSEATGRNLPRTLSHDSSLSISTPRTPRFAEATSIVSPIEAPGIGTFGFGRPLTNHFVPQKQPADGNEKPASVEMEETDSSRQAADRVMPATPLTSQPLKSALKTPTTAKQQVFSPTFHEEELLEKREAHTDKEQAKDLKAKARVRVAKFLLRGVNFSCSLIVLSMLSATFSIFNATKSLPTRMVNSNKFPPWAAGQKTWPQITILVIACVSLAMSVAVFYSYSRGGHRRAEKVAVYYTTFAVAVFVFSTVMWLLGAVILQHSRTSSNKQDMWGWSCNQNTRAALFQQEVNYALICRLQNWSLVCCIIEVVVEVVTISVYGIVFYRYWSKRRLRKSMANRDRARSDLYLAQLRTQSAPNTPGLNPFSPRETDYKLNPYEALPACEAGLVDEHTQFAEATHKPAQPKPFVLQPPPIRVQGATPKIQQAGFSAIPVGDGSPSAPQRAYSPPDRAYSGPQRMYSPSRRAYSPPQQASTPLRRPLTPLHMTFTSPAQLPQQQQQQQQEHIAAAPGEEIYEAVPIPGAYAHPSSPVQGQFSARYK